MCSVVCSLNNRPIERENEKKNRSKLHLSYTLVWIFYLVDQVWESESMYYKKNNKDLLSKKDLGSRRILIKINNMVVKKKRKKQLSYCLS